MLIYHLKVKNVNNLPIYYDYGLLPSQIMINYLHETNA